MDIFLVENSGLIVKRLCEMLGALPGAIVLGHAAGAAEAIQAILDRRPQVVLLDLELDQGSGFDVLAALRADAPEVEVYMLSNFVSPVLRELAEQGGASGFYDKTKDFEKVRDMIARRAAEPRPAGK